MKFRVIGILLVIAVLAGLYVATQDSGPVQAPQAAPTNEFGLQPLKIN